MSTPAQPTFDQLAEIIQEKLSVPRASITPDTALKDIEVDSLALIEVALVAEERFGAEIPTDEINADGTVKDLYEFVLAAVTTAHA
jgi:acyl carrier protein